MIDLESQERQALELAARVAAYPEPEMRRFILGAWLSRVPAATGAGWLREILRRGRQGGPPFDLAVAAFIALLSEPDPLGYDALVEIYREAREREIEDLAALFLSSIDAERLRGAPGRIMETGDGRQLTLGERKSLARRSTRQQIEHMMADPDPAVLRQLLLNPRLTEKDVVTIAARRPTTGERQKIVARSRRFAARYTVRRALVMNPHTPSDLAVRLAALLGGADLTLIAAEPSISPVVRESARRFLTGRREK